ncbi:unnamed protein product [Ilex paraguariensis]|uniref:Uncharacterized protein n=1 Tax=Ilex paraguariensis TaxID=185542 RepID=A0ABC8RNI1_9AQUA
MIGGNDNEDANHEVELTSINNENETNGASHSTTQSMDVSTDTPITKKTKKRKASTATKVIVDSLDDMTRVLGDCVATFGRKLDNISHRVGHGQDVSESRRKIFAKLEKIGWLDEDLLFKASYRIASNPVKVDLFFNLSDASKSSWFRIYIEHL